MSVDVSGNDVRIHELTLEDPVLASVLCDLSSPEREQLFADIVEIGARMVQRQLDGQQGDLLRREVDRMYDQLKGQIEATMSGAGVGFAEAMSPVLALIQQRLAELSGRLDGVADVMKAKSEVEAERERGTAKGRDFEGDVAQRISEIASTRGDTAQHVGDSGGLGGRAGDIVVGIDGAGGSERGRIVFEVKAGTLSRPETIRELDRVRESRSADMAVIVFDSGRSPGGIFDLREIGGDKIAVEYTSDHSLRLAYDLARARVLMGRREESGADVSGARALLESATLKLDAARAMKMKATAIASASEEMKAMIDDMVAGIRNVLERAQALLEPQSE